MLRTLSFITSHPLNRGGKLAALSRFARWQISSRLMSRPQIIPFAGETVLVVERGMTGATGNWYCGLHEQADMAFVLHFLRDDDLFLDIGANVGTYTVLAAGAVGASVVAFEPIPSTFNKLARNIAVNGIQDRVQHHNIGLGAKEGTLHFTTDHDTMNHVVSPSKTMDGQTMEVAVKQVDGILEHRPPSLAKIDVEGWEAQVLAGMGNTLATPSLNAIIMETNDSADRYAANGQSKAEQMVREVGFKPYSYDPFERKLTEHAEKASASHNTIFVRDLELAQERVVNAERFKLVNGEI